MFLVSGVAHRLQGSFELNELGGLSQKAPALTIVFVISAFSLAGIPPLSGFWAKYILVLNSLQIESYLIAAAALAVGLLTLFSMAKIWAGAFWGEAPENHASGGSQLPPLDLLSKLALYAPMFLLAGLTVTIGLMAEPFMALAVRASEQLMNPAPYIQAVLESRP